MSNVPRYVHVVITPGGPDDTSTVTCVGDENGKPYSLLVIAINREPPIKAAYPGSDERDFFLSEPGSTRAL
jgi:hypothetical protein